MKIKTKTNLIILSLSILLSAGIVIANFAYDLYQKDKFIRYVNKTANEFAEWNNQNYVKNIGPFAELYIELQVSRIASFVKHDFANLNKDYAGLRSDKSLRKMMEEATYVNNIQTSYIAVIRNMKEVVVSSEKEDEGQDVNSFLKDCSPQFSKYFHNIKAPEKYTCYFTYFDAEKKVTAYEFASMYPIRDTDLLIIYILSLEDYLAPLNKDLLTERNNKKNEIISAILDTFMSEETYTIIFSIIAFISVYLLSIPIIIMFSRSITSPINELRDEVMKIGQGHFNITMKKTGTDEINDLIDSFNSLGSELSIYTENLKNEVKQRQKIETEINIAHKIQEASLPKKLPDSMCRNFELGFKLLPAEKMAGDFYDFFFTDNKLVLSIADISGKGISAAFFMAITKTLIRNLCFQIPEPDKVLWEANKTLSGMSYSNMFATVFLGFYDLETGVLKYANAGHEPMLCINKNGVISETGVQNQLPVGLFKDASYSSETMTIEKNDIVVFYTDGITEARSPDKQFFGQDRLKNIISKGISRHPQEQCDLIIEEVNQFEHNMPYDDITVMIFKRII